MAERPTFQFRMRDLLWAIGLGGPLLGFGVRIAHMFAEKSINPHPMLWLSTFVVVALGEGIGFRVGSVRGLLIGGVIGVITAQVGWLLLMELAASMPDQRYN